MLPAIPLAAPMVAKNLTNGIAISGMQEVASTSTSPGWGLGGLMHAKGESHDEWLKDHLKEKLAELAGLDRPKSRDLHERNWHDIEARRLDSLRSVSPGAKQRMLVEWNESRDRAYHRSYLQREIDSLKEQLGPLASLL